jgi:hypothetical protein
MDMEIALSPISFLLRVLKIPEAEEQDRRGKPHEEDPELEKRHA